MDKKKTTLNACKNLLNYSRVLIDFEDYLAADENFSAQRN